MSAPPVIMPEPYTAAHAARDAAARYGVYLSPPAAEAVAKAVLECADGEHRVSVEVTPEVWDEPDVQAKVREHLRRQLSCELADTGMLPTAPPRELATRPRHSWETTRVELVVPVRRPSR